MASKFYQKHKERLRKEVCGRYQNLSEEEKEKNCKYAFKILQKKKKKKSISIIKNVSKSIEKIII